MPKKNKKVVVTKSKSEFTNIRIHDNDTQVTTREGDPDDRWDRGTTAKYHNIDEISIVGENDYCDLTAPFKIDPQKNYFLLSVIYSTGDSFGRDDGQIEFVELYSDLELAKKNQAIIEEHYKNHKSTYYSSKQVELLITNQAGKRYAYHCSWMGYFEFLQDVTIDTVSVK